jgi:hypothetical protein
MESCGPAARNPASRIKSQFRYGKGAARKAAAPIATLSNRSGATACLFGGGTCRSLCALATNGECADGEGENDHHQWGNRRKNGLVHRDSTSGLDTIWRGRLFRPAASPQFQSNARGQRNQTDTQCNPQPIDSKFVVHYLIQEQKDQQQKLRFPGKSLRAPL